MLAFHDQVKAEVTVGAVPVPIEQAARFGTVRVDTKGRINALWEVGTPQSNLASMGMYIFNIEVMAKRLAEDAARPDSPHDFGYAIIPQW